MTPVTSPTINTVQLIACPRPFSMQRVERTVPAGHSIGDLLRGLDLDPARIHARVFVDDRLVEKGYWERVRPKPGRRVTIRVIPTGGGGGGGGKDPLRIVLQIAIVAVAAVAGAGVGGLLAAPIAEGGFGLATGFAVFGGALTTVAVSTVGNLVLNALILPSTPNQEGPRHG